jgi:hypothetical protein
MTEYIPRNSANHFIEMLLSQLCVMGLCHFGNICNFHGRNIRFVHFIHCNNRLHSFKPIFGRNGKVPNFTIGSFVFSFGEEDLVDYTITYNGISVPFQIFPIDTLKQCGSHSNLNFVEFIWNFYLMKYKMNAITAVPFDENIRVLYLKHH